MPVTFYFLTLNLWGRSCCFLIKEGTEKTLQIKKEAEKTSSHSVSKVEGVEVRPLEFLVSRDLSSH